MAESITDGVGLGRPTTAKLEPPEEKDIDENRYLSMSYEELRDATPTSDSIKAASDSSGEPIAYKSLKAEKRDYQAAVDEMRKTRFIYDDTRTAEENLIALHEYQADEVERIYEPLILEMSKQVGDNKLIDIAREDAARLQERAGTQTSRQLSRYAGTPTVAQQHAIDRGVNDILTTKATTTINSARIAQKSKDEALRHDVMLMGDALASGSAEDMSEIANRQYQREVAAEQAAHQQGTNAGGTIGGIIGSYFGTVGSAVGAAIGSYIGGEASKS